MAKKGVATDLWVHDLLKEANIKLDAQGSSIKEIDDALKTASKRGTGKVGFPEYTGVVNDFLLVIEDKASLQNHIKIDDKGLISTGIKDITDYAVNGALFYAKHLAQNTTYKKILAFGVSGNEKKHKITPFFIDDRCNLFTLGDVESFISFNKDNIDEYYHREVLKEPTSSEKELKEILQDAAELHEDLRNYGNLKDEEKPLVVSGILLALREREKGNFSIDSLVGDTQATDGLKIYNAIVSNLNRANISPETKKDKILSQFSIIKDSTKLNEVNETLKETPLKYYAKFLDKKLYKTIKHCSSAEDYLGRFYGEFMSYSGGSGQTLGIILTPKHITQLFGDILDVKSTDIVFDPCCGTAGFLIAAMHKMLQNAKTESERQKIRKNQLHGIELRSDMFAIATTNMILRGDGKSNLHCDDFLLKNENDLQESIHATVGMMNPPFSQGSKKNTALYELAFTEHLLDALTEGARCAVIVPQSSMTGKTSEEQTIKETILSHHTFEGSIMLNKDTFYGVGVVPCIAVFTAGVPHPKDKVCKFINFEDDGYKVAPHIGLLETESAKDKKQHLLDVWFDRLDAPNKFCVKTPVTADDEWLHSFFYFNDELPTDADFDKTIGDYLSFEFSMIMQGRTYLFEDAEPVDVKKNFKTHLTDREWKEFKIQDLFTNYHGKRLTNEKRIEGATPFLTASELNQGVSAFISNSNLEKYKNSITVDMFGHSFFHNYECSGDDNIYFFQNDNLSNAIKKFISQSMNMNCEKFSYGKQFRQKYADNLTILLPVTSGGEPDYDFMETFVKEREQHKVNEYTTYAAKRLSELSYKEIEPLENKTWKTFFLNELFTFEKGNQNNMNATITGSIPLISAKKINNGLKDFIENNGKKKFKGNSISLNNDGDGGAGLAYYQPSSMAVDTHVTILYSKIILTKFSLLFSSVCISQQQARFGHGHSISDKRLNRFRYISE